MNFHCCFESLKSLACTSKTKKHPAWFHRGIIFLQVLTRREAFVVQNWCGLNLGKEFVV